MTEHICDAGHFDRSICPEPCGMMHSYCSICDRMMDYCYWIAQDKLVYACYTIAYPKADGTLELERDAHFKIREYKTPESARRWARQPGAVVLRLVVTP